MFEHSWNGQSPHWANDSTSPDSYMAMAYSRTAMRREEKKLPRNLSMLPMSSMSLEISPCRAHWPEVASERTA